MYVLSSVVLFLRLKCEVLSPYSNQVWKMSKLLFLAILFLNLSLIHGPSLLSMAPKQIRNMAETAFKRRSKSSPNDLLANTPSTLKMPEKDITQGLTKSITYRPLVIEVSKEGDLYLPSKKNMDKFLNPSKSTDGIPPVLKYFCPTESSDKDTCLLATRNRQCTGKAKPIIAPLLTEELRPVFCGPHDEGEMYTFSYQLCFKSETDHQDTKKMDKLEEKEYVVYDICYNHTAKETIYTLHELRWATLLLNEELKEEEEIDFEMSTYDYGHFENYFNIAKETYSKPENSNKAKQLVPPGDFVFALQKIPTFHYINVRPLHEDLIELWDYISELIRNSEIAMLNVRHLIYTGAYRITEDASKMEYIENGNISIPELWIKVVLIKDLKKERFGLAILMKNHNAKESQKKFEDYCEEDFCNISDRKDEVFKNFSTVGSSVRCCLISTEILKFFNLSEKYKAESIKFLPIDGLIDSQYLQKKIKNKKASKN
ncbi:uncharacterized protein LOC135835251 [Planococcus citri]|uniref:uncharacterized protein LOC135835251 n=1 Tax=Planococcus citri TaxID=170843 RepID=UPI0031F9BE0C